MFSYIRTGKSTLVHKGTYQKIYMKLGFDDRQHKTQIVHPKILLCKGC